MKKKLILLALSISLVAILSCQPPPPSPQPVAPTEEELAGILAATRLPATREDAQTVTEYLRWYFEQETNDQNWVEGWDEAKKSLLAFSVHHPEEFEPLLVLTQPSEQSAFSFPLLLHRTFGFSGFQPMASPEPTWGVMGFRNYYHIDMYIPVSYGKPKAVRAILGNDSVFPKDLNELYFSECAETILNSDSEIVQTGNTGFCFNFGIQPKPWNKEKKLVFEAVFESGTFNLDFDPGDYPIFFAKNNDPNPWIDSSSGTLRDARSLYTADRGYLVEYRLVQAESWILVPVKAWNLNGQYSQPLDFKLENNSKHNFFVWFPETPKEKVFGDVFQEVYWGD